MPIIAPDIITTSGNSVDLGSTLYVHDAVNPSDYVTAPFATWPRKRSRPGEVRVYAGGNRRLITRPGQDDQVQLTLQYVDQATVDALWAKAGTVVMLRGGRSDLIYGTFFDVDVQDDGLADGVTQVALTVQLVTFSDTA